MFTALIVLAVRGVGGVLMGCLVVYLHRPHCFRVLAFGPLCVSQPCVDGVPGLSQQGKAQVGPAQVGAEQVGPAQVGVRQVQGLARLYGTVD